MRRTQGWFEFCCEAFACPHEPVQGIVEPCGPCTCDEPCGHDCAYTHCNWSFGFGGDCALQANPHMFKNCPPGMSAAFLRLCKKARWCACDSYNDPNMQYLIDSCHRQNVNTEMLWPPTPVWRSVWGCIAEICRTGNGPNGAPLQIECVFLGSGSAYEGRCTGTTKGFTDPQNFPNVIWICRDNVGSCKDTTMLHEMLHLCGIAQEPIIQTGPGQYGPDESWASYVVSEDCIPCS